ncbi:MAG: hypothetical protein ACI4F9_07640 [Lachnospiraceae bacterium]
MRKQYFIFFLCTIILLICTFGHKADLKNRIHQKEKNHLENSNLALAIIRTTQEKNESFLDFYDKNFNFIKSEKLPYGTLSDYLTPPTTYQNFIYFIPRGVPLKKELEVAVCYHPLTNFCEEYHIDMPGLLQISVTDNAIFTINELNFTSYINKYEKKSKKISYLSSDEVSYDTVYYYNGFLYATGKKHMDRPNNYIFQIDPDSLKIKWQKEITNDGQGGFFFCGIEDSLYFTLPYDSNEKSNRSLMIMSLKNTKKPSLEKITLLESFPQQIKKVRDILLISHCDLIQGQGNFLSVFYPKTKKSKLISLSHNILQMEVDEKSKSIYILGDNALYHYIFNDKKDKLILQKKIDIKEIKDEKVYYYIGGFFLIS